MLPMENTMENRDQQRQTWHKKQEYLVNKDNRIRFKAMCIFTIALIIILFIYQFFPQSTINEDSATASHDHHDDDRRRVSITLYKR